MPVLGKVGLVNKGVYAAGTTYSALDFVKYNGSTFIALKSVKGVTPADDGTNWQYLARGAELALQNNLLTTQENTYALDAAQGPVIKAALDSLNTDLQNSVESGRTVNFATPTNGTLAITEATYFSRFTMFPFSFTATSAVASYANLATINGSKYRPLADTNIYAVGSISGTATQLTMQVLKNGSIRCNKALSSGQSLYVELFWISSFLD